jgi:hypothetical protein
MQETKEHGDAFDEYYAMGADRSLRSLADHQDVTERTLKRWSIEFNWQKRIVQRDLTINQRTEEKTNKAIVNTKADYRADIAKKLESLTTIREGYKKLIDDAIEAIKKGEIQINSAKELDTVIASLKKLHDLDKDYIKLDLLLVGEDVPDRTDLNIVLKLPEDLNLDDVL